MANQTSILDGMTDADLRALLPKLQAALIELSMGKKVQAVAYTQGNGSRSVTYTPTSAAQVTAMITAVQQKLGMSSGRRPIRFRF
ncbi:phage head-tail adapter protein [Azospirillum brasilense]|nr:phage head-tail adapter protein [Azospirillum brasilense]